MPTSFGVFWRAPWPETVALWCLFLLGCGSSANAPQPVTTNQSDGAGGFRRAESDPAENDELIDTWELREAWKNPRVVAKTAQPYARSIVFWPDGSRFATSSGSSECDIEVWSFPAFRRLQEYQTGKANEVFIGDIALSPDTKTLAAAAGDFVKLFDTATGRVRKVFPGHTGLVTAVAYTADGKHLVSSSMDKTLRVWTAEGELEREIKGHGGEVHRVAVSPDGKLIASGGLNDENSVKLWNLATGEEVASFEMGTFVDALAFSPDGKYLAAAGTLRSSILLWDVKAKTKVRELEGHIDGVPALAFNREGTLLVSGSHDFTIRIWDVATGESDSPLWGHRSWLFAIAFTPDQNEFLSADYGGNLLRWNVEEVRQHPERFQTIGGERDSFLAHPYPDGSLTSIALTPDGKTLFAHASGNPVCLWDVATRTLKHEIPHASGSALPCTTSYDGTMVAYGEGYDGVRVIDSETAAQVFRTPGLDGFVVAAAFLPDDKTLIAAAGRIVYGFDVPSGHEAFSWDAEKEGLESMAVLPKNSLVVTGGEEKLLKYWKLPAGKLVKSISGHQDKIISIYATSDEKKLVTMDIWNKVRVWDREQGLQIRQIDPDSSRVDVMLIAPDDRTVIFPSGSVLVIWDLKTGKIRKQLQGHLGDVWGLALMPDGKTLLSAADDGTVKFWDLPE